MTRYQGKQASMLAEDFIHFPGVYYPEDSEFVAAYLSWNRQRGVMEITTYWHKDGVKYRGDFEAYPQYLGGGDATEAVDEATRRTFTF